MTVAQALQLSSFSQAQVLAGQAGMENTITGAMVLEAADIENWGRKGQLIITSFYAIRDMSCEELSNFFAKMSRIGISGIVFKAERLMNTVPEGVIRLCRQYDIPLLRIPKEIRYEAILMDVLGHIIDSNLTLLNHFFEVHNQMMTLALEQPSVYQILTCLKQSIHTDVTFLDVQKRERISSDAHLDQVDHFQLEEPEQDGRYRYYRYYRASLSDYSGRTIPVLAVPIPSTEEERYYLLIHGGTGPRRPIDIMTIENVVSLLQMELLKQEAIRQKLFIRNNNAIHDLLSGRYPSREKVDELLAGLNLDSYSCYQVLLVNLHPAIGEEEVRLGLMPAVRKAFKRGRPGLVYFENNDQIVFLQNYDCEGQALQPADVERIMAGLDGENGCRPVAYLAAFSRRGDRYDIGALNREVMDIYRLFGSKRGESRCVRYEDLGIYKLFLDNDDPGKLESYLDPRLLRMKREAPELLGTLIALCENRLNYQETARQMYLHPKTIRYRVGRIQQNYGVDVHNTEDHLQILLAGRLMLLLNEHP